MKRILTCLLSLTILLLVICTVVSFWVEREMTTEAWISEQTNRRTINRKPTVLFPDENGDHFFEAISGTGWDSGLMVAREIPPSQWGLDWMDLVEFNGSEPHYHFIQTASRFPTDGCRLRAVEEFAKVDDRYLCFFPDDEDTQLMFQFIELFPDDSKAPYSLPAGTKLICRKDQVALVEVTDGQAPFFEHSAKGLNDTMKHADRIYSLNDAGQFLATLPWLVIVGVLLFAGLALTAAACFTRKRWLTAANLLLGTLCLCTATLLLFRLDLPASLMPPETILDFRHYANELNQVFSALDNLGLPELSQTAMDVATQCKALLVSGVSVMLLLMVGEVIVCRRAKVADDLRISYHT